MGQICQAWLHTYWLVKQFVKQFYTVRKPRGLRLFNGVLPYAYRLQKAKLKPQKTRKAQLRQGPPHTNGSSTHQHSTVNSSLVTAKLENNHVVIYLFSMCTVIQPNDGIFRGMMQFCQATAESSQEAFIDNVRHHLCCTAAAQRAVTKAPAIPVGCRKTMPSLEPVQQGPLVTGQVWGL